jgi:hypothetical protein
MSDEPKVVTDANVEMLSNTLQSMTPTDPEYVELRNALRRFQIEKHLDERE